jgi:hypothetical protein
LAVALVIFVGLVTYAPLLRQLGFYRDDWYLIWTAQSQGYEGILNLFKGDRPFLGWLYVFDYRLLGSSPFRWHVYALLIKIVGALGFLWFMRSMWPTRKIEATFITLLFLVYPGFYQQPNAATFKNLLLAYAAAMFSLACMVQAFRSRTLTLKILWTLVSLGLSVFYIFIYEALVGLEAARLLLIWYFWKREQPASWKLNLRKTVVESSPYLLFTAGFVFWRVFLFDSTRRATNVDVVLSEYGSLSLHNLARIIIETLKDLVETAFLAWGVPYYQFTVSETEYRTIAVAFVIVFLALLASAIYFFLTRSPRESEPDIALDAQVGKHWIVLGAIIVAITTMPIVLAGRNVVFGLQWDRYTYQSVFGVVLLIGGLLFYAIQSRIRWALLCGLLITGIVTQFLSANFYRNFWTMEREAVWQLSWRAPQIQDGATLILSMPGEYKLAEEYEVWAPLNLAYHPGEPVVKLPGQTLFTGIEADLADQRVQNRVVRGTIKVSRDYGKVVIFSRPSESSCFHIIDGMRLEQTFTEPLDVQTIAHYSNVNLIDTAGTSIIPTDVIFGLEPEHNWCYYYQKMDLARQSSDWQTGADLADRALSSGLKPVDVSEWLPAVEAYAYLGNDKQIEKIVELMIEDKKVYRGLCQQMKALQGQPADYDRDLLFNALCVR